MSEGRFDWHRWSHAAPWFGIAVAGAVFFIVYIGPIQEWWRLAIYFPTSTLGIGGGIGAFFGRALRGAVIALAAEFVFAYVGTMLAFSGFEDFRGIVIAMAVTAAFVWLMIRLSRNLPISP